MRQRELELFTAALAFRRRADRLIKQVASQLAQITYACLPDEIVAITTICTVQPCSPPCCHEWFLLDLNQGGFLLFYWLIHLGDKWIIDSLSKSIEVQFRNLNISSRRISILLTWASQPSSVSILWFYVLHPGLWLVVVRYFLFDLLFLGQSCL